MSFSKRIWQAAGALLLGGLFLSTPGCHSPRQKEEPIPESSLPPSQLNPIQAWNRYLGILASGDEAGMREWIYVHPGADEQTRLDRSIAVMGATSRLRDACDQTFGTNRFIRLGFHCFTSDSRVPPKSTFKIEGDHATLSAPAWSDAALIRVDNVWKEDFIPWTELEKKRSKDESKGVPLDRLLANLLVVREVLDQTAREVRSGAYLSAADAFGVVNARLHGQALYLSPLAVAYTIDLQCPSNGAPPAASSVPIIELRGDPAALGKAYAAQLGDTARSIFHDYFGHYYDLSQEKGRKDYERALKAAAGFEPYLRPEHREELHALATATGLEPAQVLFGQCFTDLNAVGGCSTIALPASASTDGLARFGRDLDYETFGLLEKHSVIVVFHPKDRYAFASITAPGLIGVLSGINEHGLCLACMEVSRSFRMPHAMPYMLLYRTLLENCRTVDEAIAMLEKTPRQSANNLMLMDASGDHAVAEITPEQVNVRRAPSNSALLSTNHQRDQDLDSPGHCVRFDFLHDAARRQFGHLSETSVEELLAGAAQGKSTLQSMVFEPANRTLHLAVGADAPSCGFTTIELDPYFRR